MMYALFKLFLVWVSATLFSGCDSRSLAGKLQDLQDIVYGLGDQQQQILKDLTVDYGEKYGRRHAREGSECDTNEMFVTENCGLDCRCVEGRMKCCRMRRSFDEISEEEIERYSNAFLTASRDPLYKEAFRTLAWFHPVMGCNMVIRPVRVDLHHALMAFHRLTLLAFENLLRLVDCRVTIPFWDVGRNSGTPYLEQRVFKIGTFGGNGVPPNYCVQGSPYGEGFYTPAKFVYKGKELPYPNCLQRKVLPNDPSFPWLLIEVMISACSANVSVLAEDAIIESLDGAIHFSLGGSFNNVIAQVDPIFYLLHSYNDKIMATYQAKGEEYRTGDGLWNTTQPLSVFDWFRMDDFLDIMNLPGGVCTRYGASRPREEAIRMKNYASLELPRDDHIYVPYEVLREMDADPVVTSLTADLAKFDKAHYRSFRWTEEGFHLDKDWRNDFLTVNFFPLKHDSAVDLCSTYAKEAANFRNYTGSAASQMLIG
eukprot:scpid63262/ scgid34418/ 